MVDLSFMSNKKHKHHEAKTPEDIVAHAHKEAEKIIEHAVHKAETIEKEFMHLKDRLDNEILNFSQQADQRYMEIIEQQSKQFEEMYKQLMTNVEKKYIEGASNHIVTMNQAVEQEISKISPLLESLMTTMRGDVLKKFQDQWQQMVLEINEYKTSQKKQIDLDLRGDVAVKTRLIIENVLRKSLTQAEHEKLIDEAVEQARDGGFFG